MPSIQMSGELKQDRVALSFKIQDALRFDHPSCRVSAALGAHGHCPPTALWGQWV